MMVYGKKKMLLPTIKFLALTNISLIIMRHMRNPILLLTAVCSATLLHVTICLVVYISLCCYMDTLISHVFFPVGDDPLSDSECDLDSVAGVLKLYFRGLEPPLFPYDSYSQLLECVRKTPLNDFCVCVCFGLQTMQVSTSAFSYSVIYVSHGF